MKRMAGSKKKNQVSRFHTRQALSIFVVFNHIDGHFFYFAGKSVSFCSRHEKEILAATGAIKNAAWFYFTSHNNVINAYPWVPSSEFKFSNELYTHEFYTLLAIFQIARH
jgi:hypothetical protein